MMIAVTSNAAKNATIPSAYGFGVHSYLIPAYVTAANAAIWATYII